MFITIYPNWYFKDHTEEEIINSKEIFKIKKGEYVITKHDHYQDIIIIFDTDNDGNEFKITERYYGGVIQGIGCDEDCSYFVNKRFEELKRKLGAD